MSKAAAFYQQAAAAYEQAGADYERSAPAYEHRAKKMQTQPIMVELGLWLSLAIQLTLFVSEKSRTYP